MSAVTDWDAEIFGDDDQDDGPETVWLDDDADWDDEDGSRGDYLDRVWSRSGFSYASGHATSVTARTEGLVVAHRMVKSFITTFAAGDVRYDVTFDPAVGTAGTDFESKKIVVSPAPVLDPTLSSKDAGLVLTAMAVHEASHDRYGRRTAAAVRRAFGDRAVEAHRLSNILDDVRIERSFVAEYPGYAHVFSPAIDYVAKAQLGGRTHAPTPGTVGFAGAAIRYERHCDFTGNEAERDWWKDWADRGVKSSSPKFHVEHVREGVAHLAQQPSGSSVTSESSTGDQDGDAQGSPESGAGTGGASASDERADAPGASTTGSGDERDETDDESAGSDASDDGETETAAGEATPGGSDHRSSSDVASTSDAGGDPASPVELPDCVVHGIEAAAVANGVARQNIDGAEAQAAVNDARTLTTLPSGAIADVGQARNIVNWRRGGQRTPTSLASSAAIRNAFMRSRSGHTGIDRGTPRGRCDSRSLHKIAFNDPRLFHRRNAPDPGRWLVWLMVDRSGSMSGSPTLQTIATTKALADASRYLPSVRLEVFGWTSTNHKAGLGEVGIYSAWRTGDDVARVDDLQRISEGGTPDAAALEWAASAIVRAAMPGERTMIVMLSDGAGYDLTERLAEARRRGVEVVSVAIGSAVDEAYQLATYGRGNYITWRGTITATARPIAQMLGRLVG